MRIIVLFIAIVFGIIGVSFAADTYVKGYTKKDGTYVAPHYKSAPDNTKSNNYSTKGNTNPYTGKKGSVDPDKKSSKRTRGY